jgi:hypothetical protein
MSNRSLYGHSGAVCINLELGQIMVELQKTLESFEQAFHLPLHFWAGEEEVQRAVDGT